MSLTNPTAGYVIDPCYNKSYKESVCIEVVAANATIIAALWDSLSVADQQNIINAMAAAGGSPNSWPRTGGWDDVKDFILPNGMTFGSVYRGMFFTYHRELPAGSAVYADTQLGYYKTTTLGANGGAWYYQLTGGAIS